MTVAENKPWFQREDKGGYCIFHMQPRELPDYSARLDLFVGYTLIPELLDRFHSDSPVQSSDFSTCGETFCYLKIDGINGLEDSLFLDKSQIEDALDNVLRSAEIGCVIGSGTGLRYSYIDMAIKDIEKTSCLIQSVLCDGRIPKRSWLLFFDSNKRDQWMVIWNDTPPPP